MAINKSILQSELLLTSGEYFNANPELIDVAIQNAIDFYSYLNPLEKATSISLIPYQNLYDLPTDFREFLAVYPYQDLFTSLYQAGFVQWNGSTYYSNNIVRSTYYLDMLMSKVEYYQMVDIQPIFKNYRLNVDSLNKKRLEFTFMPDPYDEGNQEIYVLHYYAYYTLSTLPDYHYQYIYKLASSILMEKQALAMSKVITTSGPNVTATYVNPQTLMQLARDLKNEVINALSSYVPEKG